MALIDARVLRSLEITETKGDKGTIQYSGTQDILVLADGKDPAFNQIIADETVWPNLGNVPIPQLDDYVMLGGLQAYVTSRKFSYYKDNERAVVVSLRYDAKEAEEQPPPDGTEPDAWQRITVANQQITKPALGWYAREQVPPEDGDGVQNVAKNSAGDPVDGLEEESSLIKMTYTNTKVLAPVFTELHRYTNRCNNGAFLGADDYKVRMIGWNAEYDQKNNFWSVSVEFLYNPDGWWIEYYDAGFTEIIDGSRRAILDKAGNPVSKPVPLDGNGKAVALDGSANPLSSGTFPAEPAKLKLYPYKVANMSALFGNCGI